MSVLYGAVSERSCHRLISEILTHELDGYVGRLECQEAAALDQTSRQRGLDFHREITAIAQKLTGERLSVLHARTDLAADMGGLRELFVLCPHDELTPKDGKDVVYAFLPGMQLFRLDEPAIVQPAFPSEVQRRREQVMAEKLGRHARREAEVVHNRWCASQPLPLTRSATLERIDGLWQQVEAKRPYLGSSALAVLRAQDEYLRTYGFEQSCREIGVTAAAIAAGVLRRP